MKREDFCEIFGDIDDSYIKEAGERKRYHKRYSGLRIAAVAACVAFAAYFVADAVIDMRADNTVGLPMLTVTEETGSMGFEGYMAYDISELVNANPWSGDMELNSLPVYKNQITYNDYHIASDIDFNKMRAIMTDIIGRLGLDADNITITDDAPDENTREKIIEKADGDIPEGYFNPTKLIAETEDLKIEIDKTLTATIYFKYGAELPEEYALSYSATYEESLYAAEYLKNEYKSLIGMDDPRVNICGGDYDINRMQSFQIEFYAKGKNETESIVNYNFNRVVFYFNDNGELYIARAFQPDLSEKVGDYPIISEKEANKLLLNGNYITTVPYEMPGADYVKKAELVYRNGLYDEYYMPYYRFYVELPETERNDDLKTYGAYYVPAVEGKYLSNMPAWDGSFN